MNDRQLVLDVPPVVSLKIPLTGQAEFLVSKLPPYTFYLQQNLISSKNSKRIVGKRLINSAAALKYEKITAWYWKLGAQKFREASAGLSLPLEVGFHPIRRTKAHFDFHNIIAQSLDLMQKYGWIDEDDYDHLVPMPMKLNEEYYTVHKELAGVIIKIL